jgi:hypothetical protein
LQFLSFKEPKITAFLILSYIYVGVYLKKGSAPIKKRISESSILAPYRSPVKPPKRCATFLVK